MPVIKSVTSDGRIEYCYVDMISPQGLMPQYRLYGFRSWRPNADLGTYVSIDDAVAASKKLECKMGFK